MPRACTICLHLQRDDIDRAIAGGTPIAEVSAIYRVSRHAISRHAAKHIPAALAKVVQLESQAHALDVVSEVNRIFQRVGLFYDACHEWLLDPANPDRYTLEPRAREINIIYSEDDGTGKPRRRKELLSRLLTRLEGHGLEVEGWESKHADPRDLILRTAESLKGQMELLSKLVDQKELERRVSEVEAKLAASGK